MKSPGIGLFSIEDYILIVYLDANFFLLLLKLIKDRTLLLFILMLKDAIWVLFQETAYIKTMCEVCFNCTLNNWNPKWDLFGNAKF